MIPRKQINKYKYKKRIGGLFIIRLCDGTPKIVTREFILDNIKRGYLTPSTPVKKCYRLKKPEKIRLNAMTLRSPYEISALEYHKQYYSEYVIQHPYAYARITM
jgi:hypothetical protein